MLDDVVYEDVASVYERVDFSALAGASVLVTGASGLIGSYLVASLCHLLRQGLPVRVTAVVRSDPPPQLAAIEAAGQVEILRLDLADPHSYERLPRADAIVHSAGYAQPSVFTCDPRTTLHVNSSATSALMTRLNSGGRFLFVSSSEVYSGLRKSLLSEEDIGTTTPYHPRAAYIEGKRCGELICYIERQQGIEAKSARLGHIYGPGTKRLDRRAMNVFIEQAIRLGHIRLLDEGRAVRTYCYVADAVELLWQVLLHGREVVYNIGGKSRITIAELAATVAAITGASVSGPTLQQEIVGAPEDVCLDVTRVETEFGKTQYVPLEDGLRRTVAWQRSLYAGL